MPRQPRIDLPGYPQHVVQRGNNRQVCFFARVDHSCYLRWLRMAAEKYGCAVHAYVLMSNHVHLLATGVETGSLGHMMQSLGRRYVRYVNSRYGRTGTLWEGRYKASLIDSQNYLLTCYRYIELNPVRAGIVKAPGDYRWSSFHHNAQGAKDDLIRPHAAYLSLGKSQSARLRAYRELFGGAIDDDIQAIRNHVNQGKVLGTERFRREVAAIVGRRVNWVRPGRPRKNVL